MEAKIDTTKVAVLVFPDYADISCLKLTRGFDKTLFEVVNGPNLHLMSHHNMFHPDGTDCERVVFHLEISDPKHGHTEIHNVTLNGFLCSAFRQPNSPIFIHIGLMLDCVSGANRLYPRSQFMPDVVITKYDFHKRTGWATLCPEIIRGIVEGKREFK